MKTKLFKYFISTALISTISFSLLAKNKEDSNKHKVKPKVQKMIANHNGNMFYITVHDSKFNTKPVVENSTDGIFTVSLQSNPSTGYQWFLEEYNNQVLNLINYSYIPSQDTKLIGAPGTAKWTFRVNAYAVKAPVVTYIKLLHKRAFEKNNENDSKEVITVYIQPK